MLPRSPVTYADTPNDATAMTTPQIAMTVFAFTRKLQPVKAARSEDVHAGRSQQPSNYHVGCWKQRWMRSANQVGAPAG